MSKANQIAWYLPSNPLFHADLRRRQEVIESTPALLEELDEIGVKLMFSAQGVDFEVVPGLREACARLKNIGVCNANHGHGFLSWHKMPFRKWQKAVNYGCGDFRKIRFYGEFKPDTPDSNPEDEEVTLILKKVTRVYSTMGLDDDMDSYNIVGQSLPNAPAIWYGNKKKALGIFMEGFEEFLDRFFKFQRCPFLPLNTLDPAWPNKSGLNHFLDYIEEFGSRNEGKILVVPADWETAWIGSFFGGEIIWPLVLKSIKERGLESVFTHLTDHFDFYREHAIQAAQPDRETGVKWSMLDCQRRFIGALETAEFINDGSLLNNRLFSVASGSDALVCLLKRSCLDRRQILPACNRNGEVRDLEVGYDPYELRVQLAALKVFHTGKSFGSCLDKLVSSERDFLRQKGIKEEIDEEAMLFRLFKDYFK